VEVEVEGGGGKEVEVEVEVEVRRKRGRLVELRVGLVEELKRVEEEDKCRVGEF
jgi:hypothetical protein